MIEFTDAYVKTLARGLCEPGERFVAAGAGTSHSFWSFRLPFVGHLYLLIATSDRLIAIDHRRGLFLDRMDRIGSIRWMDVTAFTVSQSWFSSRLVVKDRRNHTLLSLRLPGSLGSSIADNLASLRAAWQAWQSWHTVERASRCLALPRYRVPPPYPVSAAARHAYPASG
jgi:hypothetical protein